MVDEGVELIIDLLRFNLMFENVRKLVDEVIKFYEKIWIDKE